MSVVEFIINFFLSTFAVAYITHVIRFRAVNGGLQLFLKNVSVVSYRRDEEFGIIKDVRPVGLWDIFRRVFGAYEIEDKNTWVFNTYFWECPYCLAFWVTLLVSWRFFLLYNGGIEERVIFMLIAHFACAYTAARVVISED